MAARSLRHVLVEIAKKTLTGWPRRRPPLRRARLGLEALEDRTLLTVVWPGHISADGSVYIHNNGPGTIDYGFNGSALTVSPSYPSFDYSGHQ
jgi:hypothetical protein